MKNLLIFLTLSFAGGTAISAGPKNRVQSDLQKLLTVHRTEMQSFFAGMQQADAALPVFFCDTAFAGDRQVESFLRNVSAGAASGQVYSQVSFTQFVSINGNMRSVSYNLVNNGGNVTFVKSANINGQMLRAVYEYDSASRKLKTGAFEGKKPIKNSEYSI